MTVRAATVAGRRLVVDGAGQDLGFVFDGVPTGEGVEVRLVLDQHRDALPVRIDDRGHALRKVSGPTPSADRVLVEPVTVTRTRTL